METACREFIKALHHAEQTGTSSDIFEIGKHVRNLPAGVSILDVFRVCKDNGWVMGSTKGAWLTPQGQKKLAG